MNDRHRTWHFDDYDWSDRYDDVVAQESTYYARYDEVLEFVVAAAGIAPGMRVLDIATGTGNLALRCLARGAEVVGLDPSERMLAGAREKTAGKPGVELRQVDQPFLRIPYPDESFDAVVSTYAFHHVPHHLKRDGIREMTRVLRLGRSLVLGDLAFVNADEEAKALQEFAWLEEEYFMRIEGLRPFLTAMGMDLNCRRFTPVTWVLWATKQHQTDEYMHEC